jgi:hypothetical protein
MFVLNDSMHVRTRELLNGKLLDISIVKPYFAAWQKEKQTNMQSGQPRMTSSYGSRSTPPHFKNTTLPDKCDEMDERERKRFGGESKSIEIYHNFISSN